MNTCITNIATLCLCFFVSQSACLPVSLSLLTRLYRFLSHSLSPVTISSRHHHHFSHAGSLGMELLQITSICSVDVDEI